MLEIVIASEESWSDRRASHQQVFMVSCLAISNTCFYRLPSRRVSPTRVLYPIIIGLMCSDGSVDIFFHDQDGFSFVRSCCYSREWLRNSVTKLCCMTTGK